MNPKLYEEKRNELVGLIDKTLAIQDLPASACAPLEAIRKKVFENQFEITLVAAFGGGKTTTLNALCDGREIGPRGFGIKTSGCLVSVQNIADPAASEGAEVTWRTKRQLVLGFADLLKRPLAEKAPERFKVASAQKRDPTPQEIAEELDLDCEKDMALVRALLEEEWNVYGGGKEKYSGDDLDLLRTASLTLHFYDTPAYRTQPPGRQEPGRCPKVVGLPNRLGATVGEQKAFRFSLGGGGICVHRQGSMSRSLKQPGAHRLRGHGLPGTVC